jgi:hypothetical protein
MGLKVGPSHVTRTEAEGVWEQSAEERWSNRKMEKKIHNNFVLFVN